MKIAIIADPLDNQRAGVHVYLRELVNALVTNPGNHEYVLIRERVDPDLPLPQYALPNVRLPIGYASFRLFVLVPRLLIRLGVDAVFEPAHFGPFNLPARIRRITMIHDLTPILFPHFHRWHSQMLQRLFLPGILRRADRVVANSNNTATDLARVYPRTAAKTETILLGVPGGFFPNERTNFLTDQDIDAPYFLYVGTVEPRKNLVLLLEAYAIFRQQTDRRVLLVLVGQLGWKNKNFATSLVNHPFRTDIRLTGFIPKEQLPQAYYHALSLVYPSVYEGFGFPIAEAFACGTGVICPRNSSLPEVGGDLARYYPTHDAAALADCLLEVSASGPPTARQRAAYQDHAATFSWSTYATIFNRMLDRMT